MSMRLVFMASLLLTTVLLAPGGHADIDLTAQSTGNLALMPDAETGEVTFTGVVTCESVHLRRIEDPSLMPDGPIPVTFNFTTDPGVVVVGGPRTHLLTGCVAPTETTATFDATYSLAVTRAAVANRPMSVAVQVALPPSELDDDPTTATTTLAVSALPMFLMEVQVAQKLVQAETATATYHLGLANFGNGRVAVTVEAATDGDMELEFTLPDSVILETPNLDGTKTKTTLAINVEVPRGQDNQEATITWTIRYRDTLVGTEGEPVVQHVLLRTASTTKESPAAPWPLLLLALVGWAVASSRR